MLFIHGERLSSKHCPSLYGLEKTTHTLTRSMTSGDKRTHVRVYCRVLERLGLLKDGDNKRSGLSALH